MASINRPNRRNDDPPFEVEYNTTLGNGTSSDGNNATKLGMPIAYSCKELLRNNQATPLQVEYYYDLLRNDIDDEMVVLQQAEGDLLDYVATGFGLKDGARCSVPPVGMIWLVRVSSSPRDEPVDIFDRCFDLTPKQNQDCKVYKGMMTGFALGANFTHDSNNVLDYIESFMRQDRKVGSSYDIRFLGTQIDTTAVSNSGRSNLPPAINAVERPPDQEPTQVSLLGGFLVALFALACLGIVLVLYRRRRKWLTAQDVEIALSKSNPRGDPSPSPIVRRKVERHLVEVGSDGIEEDSENGDSVDRGVNTYAFDLGDTMKNQLFGIHGGGGKTPRGLGLPGVSGEDLASDSDADSWAQTDGTIGSLELQLEPITAEV